MNILFDKDWEIKNWYDTCTKEVIYGIPNGSRFFNLGDIPEEVREIARNTEEEKEKIYQEIRRIFEKFLQSEKAQKLMNEAITKAKTRWEEKGKECLTILSCILDIPCVSFEGEYNAYFTFSKRCPFHGNAFMFCRFSDFLKTAMHEIMHIEFLKAYREYCKKLGLSDTQISHLKEILTVLLNEEMGDYFNHPDQGYAKHQEIREKIQKLYCEKNRADFPEFLKHIAPMIKEAFSQ